MKQYILIFLSLATAKACAWLFERLFEGLTLSDLLSSSYRADDLGNTHYYYAFGYGLVFALSWFLRWPTTPLRRAAASTLVLLGGVLPLLSVCSNYYLHSRWLVSEIFYLEKWALLSLLVAHGVLLLLLNGLFYFRRAPQPTAPPAPRKGSVALR